jgi:hypothetical protein
MIEAVAERKGSCRIIDVGGRESYWANVLGNAFLQKNLCSVVIVNRGTEIGDGEAALAMLTLMEGDGCDLRFDDSEFDIAHSNSVVEHVGTWGNMEKFSREIRRVGNGYFVQTPNFWFPWDPHFGLPLFQLLPDPVKVSLLLRYGLGHFDRQRSVDAALRAVERNRLLDQKMFRVLFADGELVRERFLGMTKSLIAVREPSFARGGVTRDCTALMRMPAPRAVQ